MDYELQPHLLARYFAGFLARRSGLAASENERFTELIRELSLSLEEGHSCLAVSEKARTLLEKSPLVSAGADTPLVLHSNRLYLQRYFQYESRLAAQLCERAGRTREIPELDGLLDRWFAPETGEPDWQRRAAAVALCKSLCIISGGPGTGKTTTVVRILGLLLAAEGAELRIALAAPTGKAAMRLQESVAGSLESLRVPLEIASRFPTGARTLHRLLGVIRHAPRFRHHAERPLPLDVLVIDEASMVDLAMMSKVVDALPPTARLILLGDKDQLASVESGSVLPDMIRSLPDNTALLQKSYRFDAGIKALATAINRGDGEGAWAILSAGEPANVGLLTGSSIGAIGRRYAAYMETVTKVAEVGVRAVFRAFAAFQVLCPGRHGSRGVAALNAAVEKHLRRKGYACQAEQWYPGRPVLITTNEYSLELYNGDVGICLPDPVDGEMKVWFERGDGGLRGYLPARLPRHETVFAMTIHKSQGSEFGEVLVILPEEESRLLNRQLLYTGVTRAKERVRIVASKSIFVYAVGGDYPRSSGLADLLQIEGTSM